MAELISDDLVCSMANIFELMQNTTDQFWSRMIAYLANQGLLEPHCSMIISQNLKVLLNLTLPN